MRLTEIIGKLSALVDQHGPNVDVNEMWVSNHDRSCRLVLVARVNGKLKDLEVELDNVGDGGL